MLDRQDVDAVGRTALESNAIRVIDFNYDYSLCPNTQNSFTLSPTSFAVGPLTGKLTLKAVTTRGRGGASGLPAIQFGYELPQALQKSATGTLSATGTASTTYFQTSTPAFQVGDMVQNNGTYYGVVVLYNSSNQTYTLGNSSVAAPASPVSIALTTTKNPPYYNNAYDMWGMYKSDYDPPILQADENLGRNTSGVSAPGTDAWSLRSITTQLGDQIGIIYQPDSYHTVDMNNTPSLIMSNLAVIPGTNNGTISFQLANSGPLTNPGTIITKLEAVFTVQLLVEATTTECCGCLINTTPQPTSLTMSNIQTSNKITTYTGTLGAPINQIVTFDGTIWTGNLFYSNPNTDYFGGGIRVGSLLVNHTLEGSQSGVSYSYNTPGSSFSSGATSYLPTVLDAYDAEQINANPHGNFVTTGIYATLYQQFLYRNTNSLYPIVRELPPPGVTYQYVTQTDTYTAPDEQGLQRNVAGSTLYQFDVLNPNWIGRVAAGVAGASAVSSKNWYLQSFTGNVGNLVSTTQFDAQGNMLKQTVNHYQHDGLEAQGLGLK